MDSQKMQEMKKQREERGRRLSEIGIALDGIESCTYGPGEKWMSTIAASSIVVVVMFWIVSILLVVENGIRPGYATTGAVVLPVIAYGIFQMGNWLNRMFGTWLVEHEIPAADKRLQEELPRRVVALQR